MIDASYVYLGYVLDKIGMDAPGTDVAEVAALLGANIMGTVPSQALELVKYVLCEPLLDGKRDYVAAAQRADKSVTVTDGLGNGDGDTVYRMAYGIERFITEDKTACRRDAKLYMGHA